MGTEIILTANLEENEKMILAEMKKTICDFSDRFSRFIPDNELWKLNHTNGRKIQVSPIMIEMLTEMKKFHRLTGGVFDSTIIGVLEDVGYDRDFSLIKDSVRLKKKIAEKEITKKHFSRIPLSELEIFSDSVRAPRGFRVDTGGIGKGYIVDFVAKKFLGKVSDYWLSAGGDILAHGHRTGGFGWEVGVQDPLFPSENKFILKTQGEKMGIATSGVIKRKGERDGISWHHLIDPRSGVPVKNDILSVTVIASSATRADILAKTVLTMGEEEGLEFIDKQDDAECIIFFQNKPPLVSRKMYKYIK